MTNTIRTIGFAFFTTLLFSQFAYAVTELPNLDSVKQQLIHYYESGNYAKDQAEVVDEALRYLTARIAEKHVGKLAIVLDIDETSLSNYPDMVNLNFGGTFQEIDDDEAKGTDTAIEPTLKLYNFAKSNHVAVFFVTGRRERYQIATIKNLESAGYNHFDGLVLKPDFYKDHSAAPYKINARKYITEHGYDIVLNMGDQQSDLIGGYADKTFKLPNPYYLIP